MWTERVRAAVDGAPPRSVEFTARERDGSWALGLLKREWSVWPFGNTVGNVGLLLRPGFGWQQWPSVAGSGGAVATSSTTASATVAPMLYIQLLRRLRRPARVERARAAFVEQRPYLDALDAALGGDGAGLSVLAEVFTSPMLPFRDQDPARVEAFHAETLIAMDPSPANRAFRAHWAAQRAAPEALAVPDGLGPWESAALWLLVGRHLDEISWEEYPVPPLMAEAAWRLLHRPPQLDGHIRWRQASHVMRATGVGNATTAAECIVLASKATGEQLDAWADSPLFQTVMVSAADDPSGPWHLGYMEAAAGFDGLGEPERAWELLCAGTYWAGRRGGPWRPWFDAALALARRNDWTDVVIALEDMAALAQID